MRVERVAHFVAVNGGFPSAEKVPKSKRIDVHRHVQLNNVRHALTFLEQFYYFRSRNFVYLCD